MVHWQTRNCHSNSFYIECRFKEASGLQGLKHFCTEILAGRRHVTAKIPRQDAEKGFTLVELLVVLAILGLLIALVAPAMIRQLGSAKHKIAEQSIERLSGVLDLY